MIFDSSGLLLLSCVLMCSCFSLRKKDQERSFKGSGLHSALDENSSSVQKSGPLQKVLASPSRQPGSPLRSSGTLLRPPGSPSKAASSSLRAPPSPKRLSLLSQSSGGISDNLSLDQITRATQNFSPSMKIGEGAFGTVYKAIFPDGQVMAVKLATKEHFPALQTEVINELELLARIEHMCLVRFLGFIDRGNEIIIITEYVSNGTLREHLDAPNGQVLDFSKRLEIAIDIAHGLTHLHLFAERMIIHRDIKSSNILITDNFRAKVADFGFAKISHEETEHTHISTKVKGTFGYLDPEYLRTNKLSPKSDVFSFGVLLIEIFSGRRPVERKKPSDERLTIKWAFKMNNEGRVKEVLDPLLSEEVEETVLSQIFNLAFRCVASVRSARPAMNEVSRQLWEIRKNYNRSLQKN